MSLRTRSLFVLAVAAGGLATAAFSGDVPAATLARSAIAASSADAGTIPAYRARFGRARPVVAIVAENRGTELTDYVIPFGVLAQSGVAETITLATRPGAVTMRPALHIQPQATIAEFDDRFPDGADYVIVPAVVNHEDPALLAWISAQAAKGSSIVSICDGALVVANSGLLKGRHATAHWATEGQRKKSYPDTVWVRNIRYVADGRIVSSAGISAAIPTSIALVEAIAGRDRAMALARTLGVADWSTAHNSDMFRPRFGVNLMAYARTMVTNQRLHSMQSVGVPVAPGVDEIALALTADAWSRTGRSQAYALSLTASPLQTRNGLTVLPDRIVRGKQDVDVNLPAFNLTKSALVLDQALAGIAARFGRSTAYGVALSFEYAGFAR